MLDKYKGQSPQRATSIDGFVGAGQQPRRPAFRGTMPTPDRVSHVPSETLPPPRPSVYRGSTPISRQIPTQNSVHSPQDATKLQDGPEVYSMKSERDTTPSRAEAEQPGKIITRRDRRAQRRADKKLQQPSDRRRTFKKVLKIFGVLLLLVVLAFGLRFYKDIAKLTGNSNPFSVLTAFRPAHLDNENGRVNILVAGNSADDAGHNGGNLTDSIMILSLDTKKNTAMMLSVPRDTWVNIPGEGHSKINAAYTVDGMETLKDVIETELELPIHYDVLVNYSAFKDLVDAVGGISINIQSDNPRGIYDSSLDYTSRTCCALAKYPNGPVTLNGKQALNLARARGEGYGSYGFENADFDRTENQRKMLLAIKAKASSTAVVANPLKISNLVSAVGNNVTTDLQINELQTLYYYMKKVDDTKIDSYNINNLKGENTTMLANYTSPNGQSALIPAAGVDDFSEIAAQIRKLFTAGPLVKEAANVVVMNGTESVGLARLQSSKLSAKGVSVVATADAPVKQATTTIIDNSLGKKPNTLAALKKQYNATVITDQRLSAAYPGADFIVVLGQNVADQVNAAAKNGSTTN